MELISRKYENLDDYIKKGKATIIYGPRQVGKTTILLNFLKKTELKYRLETGDNIFLQNNLPSYDINQLNDFVANIDLLAIDEAQNIPDIGRILKSLVDQNPNIIIIVTGSSSFDLHGQIGEPLTGRKKTITLYPISQFELKNHLSSHDIKINLENYLIYGSYPEVITAKNNIEKREIITEIAQSYLLKDILAFEKIKNPKVLINLLRLMALQLGSEVSLNELATNLKVDVKTVAKYLDLLEQGFVIKSLNGFSRNLRKEITKKNKYYFLDLGIRNAVIANFNKLDLRNDIGGLWENFLIIERIKKLSYENIPTNMYFWRTWDKKELDFIEESDGILKAYEFKWSKKDAKPPKEWIEEYKNSTFTVINRDNYLNFV